METKEKELPEENKAAEVKAAEEKQPETKAEVKAQKKTTAKKPSAEKSTTTKEVKSHAKEEVNPESKGVEGFEPNLSTKDVGTVDEVETSSDFDSVLADIKQGKKVTLSGEKDVYYVHDNGRLNKYSKEGGFLDSAPLFEFQGKKGWNVEK